MILKSVFITSTVNANIARNLSKSLSRMMSTANAEMNDVIFEEVDNKGVMILNRPKALNALNTSMVNKILPKLKEWESKKIFVLVKGAGGKAFCAGGDVREVVQAGLKGERLGYDFFRKEYTVNGLIGNYKIPYIALIDGIVMGGGVGLSVHGKYRVATEKTLFAMPETQIGLFPDVGGSYFLPRLNGKLGVYLALTGQRLQGIDVFLTGIATHYCPSSKLPELEKALLTCNDEQCVTNTLQKFHTPEGNELSLSPYLEKINNIFASKSIEEIMANLEKDGSEWAKKTASTLQRMCPTSLKVTLKELELGSKMNLLECLQMEYRLACSCLDNKDFYEGVRALLIDKDQKPSWTPPTLKEVTDKLVESRFSKLPDDQELKHKL